MASRRARPDGRNGCNRSICTAQAKGDAEVEWLPGFRSRREFVEKRIHPTLHQAIFDLSDMELMPLDLACLVKTEKVWWRRKDLQACDDPNSLRHSFSESQYFIENHPAADTMNKRFILDDRNRRIFISRSRFTKYELRAKLAPLSDGAIRALTLSCQGQPEDRLSELLEKIQSVDTLIGGSRGSYLKKVVQWCNKEKIDRWKIKLAYLSDYDLRFTLTKKNKEKWRSVLTNDDFRGQVETNQAPKNERNASILADIQKVTSDDLDEEIVVVSTFSMARDKLSAWKDALEDSNPPKMLGVSAVGQLHRDGHIKYLAVSSDMDEPLVFDLASLTMNSGSDSKAAKALFYKDGPLHTLKCLLESDESKECLKIVHSCSQLADVLQHVYDVKLQFVFDTAIAWEQMSDEGPETATLLKIVKQYKPSLEPRLKKGREEEKQGPIRLLAMMRTSSEAKKTEKPDAQLQGDIASALVEIALQMMPKLEQGAIRFRQSCAKMLELYRAWPGQHLGSFALGTKQPFYFAPDKRDKQKLCVALQEGSAVGQEDSHEAFEEEEKKLYNILPEELRKDRSKEQWISCGDSPWYWSQDGSAVAIAEATRSISCGRFPRGEQG
eukprot:symbB.v1.2.039056.t1/scaffold6321.1/size19036/2